MNKDNKKSILFVHIILMLFVVLIILGIYNIINMKNKNINNIVQNGVIASNIYINNLENNIRNN